MVKITEFEIDEYVEMVSKGDRIPLAKATLPKSTIQKFLEEKLKSLDKVSKRKVI